ncbi:hypothetical protein ISU02_08855 [Fusibacter sp. Q10-2]|uniref:Uncharacterized protein n=2 Tax=Fusibacter ferrireducens TaxID=2785058 RepID=A0ABR9ZRZ5_9FIRM|nr:hypothetical protein [Fusibacter ferrireducens]
MLIAIAIYFIGIVFMPNKLIQLLMVVLMPVELYFVQNQAFKLYPKLISYKSDSLETSKSIHKSNLIVTDMNHLVDYSNSRIAHLETFDLEIALSEHSAVNDKTLLGRKNMTKLLQTALLCAHEDERLVPSKIQLQSLFPIDEIALSAQWPKIRAWQNEGLWLTQHQEIKTHMTQLMCMGDLDQLLERCTHVLTQNGIDILKKEHVAKIIASEHKHGHALERVWGYAFKIDSRDNVIDDIPSDLIYIGAISIFAPIKTTPKIAEKSANYFEKIHCDKPYKVITFSQESPIYVNAIAKHLNLLNEESRVFDQSKLITFSNKTLAPVLHRYTFMTRFNEDQVHRIVSLYRKNTAVILKTACEKSPLKQLDDTLFDYFVDKTYEEKSFSEVFEESKTLVIRFDKLKSFIISLHLVELITLRMLFTVSPYLLLLLNLSLSGLLGLALFVETVDTSKPVKSKSISYFNSNILHIGIWVGLYCLMISYSNYHPEPLFFMGLVFVGMAFIFQYPVSISLRKIAFHQTALNTTSGILILIFMIGAFWSMRFDFEFTLLTQLVMYAMTPMILHDLIKLSRSYLNKISKRLKS